MKYIVLFFALLSSLLSFAQQMDAAYDEPLTLEELLKVGLEHNYSLRITRNKQWISDNNVTRANAGFLPKVTASGGYGLTYKDTQSNLYSGETTRDNGVLNQTINAGVDVSWYIFDGFRVQTTYDKLKDLQRLGEINTRISIEDFIAELAGEYYNLIQQQLRLNNYAYSIKLSLERVRIADKRRVVGSGSGLDILQARVDLNADSSSYVNQQTRIVESMIRINNLLSSGGVDRHLTLADTLIKFNCDLDYNEMLNRMGANNASLLAVDENSVIAEKDLKLLKARNYPYITMGAGYGYTWNRFGSGSTRSRNVLGPDVGLTVGFTIFDGNRRREQANARMEIVNKQLQKESLDQSLRAQLLAIWQAYQNNIEVYRMEKENVKVARQNHDVAMYRYYTVGDLSGIEMREAQRSLLNAEDRLLTSQYNTKICEISLLQISGEIFTILN